jgi:hypothetical protein
LESALRKIVPEDRAEPLMILFKVVSRRSWDDLQAWHEAFPGSRVEHVLFGIYALIIKPGGARGLTR